MTAATPLGTMGWLNHPHGASHPLLPKGEAKTTPKPPLGVAKGSMGMAKPPLVPTGGDYALAQLEVVKPPRYPLEVATATPLGTKG